MFLFPPFAILLLGCGPNGWKGSSIAWVTIQSDDQVHVEAPGDLTGDGNVDLLLSTEDNGFRKLWVVPGPFDKRMKADGDGFFLGVFGRGVAVAGDVNGDGASDLVSGGDQMWFYPGPFSGEATGETAIYQGEMDNAWATGCDVDGDGEDEVVATNYYGSRVVVIDDPATNPVVLAENEIESGIATAVPYIECLGDVDADGLEDFRAQSGAFIGSLASPAEMGESWLGVSWRVGDATGDGHGDLMVPNGQAVSLIAGPLDGNLSSGAPLQGTDACWGMARQVVGGGDLNGDGVTDVLVGLSQAAEFPSYEEESECVPQKSGRVLVFYGPISGSLVEDEADAVYEGSVVRESCHEVGNIYGGDSRVCNEKSNDYTGMSSPFPTVGYLPDQDGDGGDELWVRARSDYDEWTVFVIPGGDL